MTELVDQVVRLAEACQAAGAASPDGPEDWSIGFSDAEQVLYRMLVELPLASLQRLQTLMYFGRGDSDDLLWLHQDLHGDGDIASRLAHSMVEKAPLAEYLRRGVERAHESGIDLVAWEAGNLTYQPPAVAPREPYAGPVFRVAEPIDGRDPVAEGAKLFLELADELPGDIVPAQQADAFFRRLREKTGGLVIVDFIDLGDWDCLAGHEFDALTGWLTLYWHDQRADPDGPARMVFPADLYGLVVHLDHIRIVRGKETAFFLLRGFSTTPNRARKRLREGAADIHVREENIFSTKVARRIGGQVEVLDIHSAPLYTIALLPKGLHIPSSLSRRLLFHANLVTLARRLDAVISALQAEQGVDDDLICEKGNTVRRVVEQALKIEVLHRDLTFPKPYAQLQLGDLIGGLRDHHPAELRATFAKVAEWANEMSHDSGVPVRKDKALALATLVLLYVKLLQNEIT